MAKRKQEKYASRVPRAPLLQRELATSLLGAEAPPGPELTGTSCPAGCFHGNEVRLATSPSFKRATCLKKAQHAALFLRTYQIYSMKMRHAELMTMGKADPSHVSCVILYKSVSLSGPKFSFEECDVAGY